jgi:hypothetical protein
MKAENQRRTDNSLGKEKKTTGQTTIYKTLHRKLKHRTTRIPQKPGLNSGAPEGCQFLFHM